MNIANIRKIGMLSIIIAPLLAISSSVYASGSYNNDQSVKTEEQKQYHAGKSALRKKLKCSGCILEGKKINSKTAAEVLNQLKSGEFSNILAAKEEKAVAAYLTQRYRIK